jgi:hypothetical protein
VLDEAHVYSGAMAAEITMLLRRAWLRWGLDPHGVQGIVTSATMHQRVEGGPKLLQQFAADIMSKSLETVSAIEGRRAAPTERGDARATSVPPAAAIAELDTDFQTLGAEAQESGPLTHVFHDSEEAQAGVTRILQCLRSDAPISHDGPPALRLWRALAPLGWVRRLRKALYDERLTVDGVAGMLFGNGGGGTVRRKAVHKVLEILSFARLEPGELPLMPVRLHAIMRGPHGIFACVDGRCPRAAVPDRIGALYPDPVDRCDCGAIVCELRVCEGCGQSFFIAGEGPDPEKSVPRLLHLGPKVADLLVPGATWDDSSDCNGTVVRVTREGLIIQEGGLAFSSFPGGRLVGPTRQLISVACPRCALARPAAAVIRKIEGGTDAALQVILDGIYPSLPEHANSTKEVLPGQGRRALYRHQIVAGTGRAIELE